MNKSRINQKGTVPILFLLAAFGIIAFLLISSSVPFKDKLFNSLYPKPPSHANEQAESVPDEILLRFKTEASESDKENIKKEHGLERKDEIKQIGVERMKVPADKKDQILEALKHNPNIEYAEPNILGQIQDTPDDPLYTSAPQWQLTKVSAPAAWDISKGSSSVIVAVLDTGVNSSHEDLVGKLVPGYNYMDNNTDTSDVHGHGTLVVGAAGAATNDSKGVASLGRNITVMPMMVGTSTGAIGYYAAAQATIYAIDHGAKIINMSFGSSIQDNTLQNAINYAWSKGAVIVAAGGNSGTTPILYPASGDHTIAVAGTDQNDHWATTNYGPGLDVVAPMFHYSTNKAGGYSQVSGTSFSSPMVAALAGLIMSANPALNNQQVVDIIIATVDKVDTSANGGYDATGWNDHFGFGRINAYKALQMATGAVPAPTSTPTATPIPTPTPITAPSPTFTPSPTVTPIPSDNLVPAVSITSPLNGAIVKVNSKLNINASASDNIKISKVEFYVNNTLKCTSTLSTNPYSCIFSVPGKKNTSYTIQVKAYDASNNTNSASITVKAQ